MVGINPLPLRQIFQRVALKSVTLFLYPLTGDKANMYPRPVPFCFFSCRDSGGALSWVQQSPSTRFMQAFWHTFLFHFSLNTNLGILTTPSFSSGLSFQPNKVSFEL